MEKTTLKDLYNFSGFRACATLKPHISCIQGKNAEKKLSFKFHGKIENVIGLQITDLVAYPLARHILKPGEPYVPFQVIEKKIYANKAGIYDGWGLKVFP